MWVQMRFHISGGRADGRNWPEKGGAIEVPNGEGMDLVLTGKADEVAAPAAVQAPSLLPAPELAASGLPVSEPEAQPEVQAGPEVDEPEPAPGDSKQAWVDFAVSQGASPQEAATLTKAQLMTAYGGRL